MAFDWKSIVRTVAPGLAATFGTPLAGAGVKFLVDGLLGPNTPAEKQEEMLSQALATATPETLLKLKQLDADWSITMRKLDIEEAKTGNEDRANARERERERRDDTPRQLAFITVGGFIGFAFGQLIAMVVMPIFWPTVKFPPEFWVLLGNVTGYMAAKADGALGYYFGASPPDRRGVAQVSPPPPVKPPTSS